MIKIGNDTITRVDEMQKEVIVSEDYYALLLALEKLTAAINKLSEGIR